MVETRQRIVAFYTFVVLLLCIVLLARGLWRPEGEESTFASSRHLVQGSAQTAEFRSAYREHLEHHDATPPQVLGVALGGFLPPAWVLVLWSLANLALVLGIFRGLDFALGLPLTSEAKFAGFLLAYPALFRVFSSPPGAALDLWVLGVLLGGFVWARRGGGFGGGIALGLAAALRVSTLVVLGWVLLRERGRTLLGLAAAAVLFAVALPGLWLGFEALEEAWRVWWGQASPSADTATLRVGLRGTLAGIVGGSGKLDLVFLPLAITLTALLVWASWRRSPGRRLAWSGNEIASVTAAAALLTTREAPTLFVLLWPAAVLGFDAWRRSEGTRCRQVAGTLWATAFVASLVAGFAAPQGHGALSASWTLAALCLLGLVAYPGFFPRPMQPRDTQPGCAGSSSGDA